MVEASVKTELARPIASRGTIWLNIVEIVILTVVTNIPIKKSKTSKKIKGMTLGAK